jgi:flagellar biosynthesis protein FlhF
MKLKHYRAPDMRQAMKLIREQQGPDAVIVSSKRVAGGVEVVAAIDYDERTVIAAAQSAPTTTFTSEPASLDDFAALAQRMTGEAGGSDVSAELRTLRQMLETQVATLAWNDLTRRAPIHTELLERLSVLGLARDLAAELVAQLPARLELAEAHRLALALIARRIATSEERWLDQGGIVAMVGPTGVGKTTLIGKLAARWVLQHGPRELALVCADSMRIGAQDQMQTLGRLLGVPVYGIDSMAELPEVLATLRDRRLVLIDTAGLSQRDVGLEAVLRSLRASSRKLETCLVMSASAQAGAIEETVARFAPAEAASCVLTKLDEATSLGGVISTLIRTRLPLAYVSDGQRIPEDLSPARAHQLIARAVDLAKKAGATADEDLLKRRFGRVAHALA